ncbi:MAG: T9SS type A sorting domain-containing protein [Lewinellaceae bacterium]|nr:T9SS type A sorting domain-containing protein [Lewinellaceae bacterium]
MKFHFTLLVSILLSWTFFNSYGQTVVPIDIQFTGIQQNWSYISIDTNFIKSPLDKWSTPYWGHRPIDAVLKEDQIIILENCTAQSPYGTVDGCLMHALDQKSGELRWIFHNNSYVGLKHREDYFGQKMYIDSDSNVEIIGYKAMDTLDKTQANFTFFANPIRKTINPDNGLLVSEQVGQDTSRLFFKRIGLGSVRMVRNNQNDLLFCGLYSYYTDSTQVVNFRMSNVYQDMELDHDLHTSFSDTIARSDTFFPNVLNNWNLLSNDTMLLMYTAYNSLDKTEPPKLSKLVWLDISDIHDIKVIREKDVSSEYSVPQDGNFPAGMILKDGTITINQLMIPSNSPVDAKWFNWLLWLDKNGNTLAKVPYIYDRSRNYSYVYAFDVRNDALYVAVSASTNTEHGVDILKIKKGSDVATVVGHIITPKIPEFDMGNYNIVKPLPEDNILVGFQMDYNLPNDITSVVQYYFSFKMEDLGISTSTHEDVTHEYIHAYPNPTHDFLNINLQGISGTVDIRIFDQKGRNVYVHTGIGDGENILDLSNLSAGTYIYQVYSDGKTAGIGSFVKVE